MVTVFLARLTHDQKKTPAILGDGLDEESKYFLYQIVSF